LNIAAFCSFLPILDRFLFVLFEAHLADAVKVSELAQSGTTAKIGSLAKEVNALCLIHRQSSLPIAVSQCQIDHGFWILLRDSLAYLRQNLFRRLRQRSSAKRTRTRDSVLHLVLVVATTTNNLAAARTVRL
jgi:hypothetical protein